jgi:ketosteroid isomerase-like protein
VTTIIVAFQRSDPPISDEDQIRETLNSLAEAYNNADHDSYVNYFCPAERSGLSDEAELRQDRAETGRIDFDVVAIEVTGDTAKVTATASVENEDEPDTDTLDFVKQDGRWMVLLFGDECSA